jgi:competence protein ComEA
MRRPMLALVTMLALSLAAAHTASAAPAGGQEAKPTKAPKVIAIVNLNTATAAELDTLPGIGPKTAARIVEYRQKNGGFKKIEELINVRGVGEKSFLKLKAYVTVGSARPATAPQQ